MSSKWVSLTVTPLNTDVKTQRACIDYRESKSKNRQNYTRESE